MRQKFTRFVSSRPAPGVAGFAVFSALPGLLALAGALQGGIWTWLALVWIGGASQIIDIVLARPFSDSAEGKEYHMADSLLVFLALLHLAVLWAMLGAVTDPLRPTANKLALLIAAGMFFGQVSNAAAHEMIHRPKRLLFRLGMLTYISILFGHHVSAHRLVHHRYVATDQDPNSARLGESFWRFFPRAWIGSFRAGLQAERKRHKIGAPNPYLYYVGGSAFFMLMVLLGFGKMGLLLYMTTCLYAHLQLLLSDYVQHYGLRRKVLASGRYEPAGPLHSWDAPHPLSGLMMVNAPRHSDHHANPMRPYPTLRLDRADNPRPFLPYSLPVMGAIATIPPLWRRIMDKRVGRMNDLSDIQQAGTAT